jgi:hypothetical protein
VNNELEPKAFELVCYMVTSACNLLQENPLYGPFRLVDAASRLITALEEEGVQSPRLAEIRERIAAGQYTVMEDEDVFANFLQDLVMALIPMMDTIRNE